jgi:hypothetical protein
MLEHKYVIDLGKQDSVIAPGWIADTIASGF